MSVLRASKALNTPSNAHFLERSVQKTLVSRFCPFKSHPSPSFLLLRHAGPEQEMIAAILVTVSEEYVRIAVKAVNSLAK